MDGLLKLVAPFLYLYASTACLGDLLLLSINLRYTRTVNVVFYCIVAVLLQLPDTVLKRMLTELIQLTKIPQEKIASKQVLTDGRSILMKVLLYK